MELYLKNIGKIRETTIAINGITVIAGENNTGKSTVSRTLFSVLNSFNNVDERIREEMIDSLAHILIPVYSTVNLKLLDDAVCEIIKHIDDYKENPELLRMCITKSGTGPLNSPESGIDRAVTRVSDCLNVSRKEIFCASFAKNLNTEFDGQIQNIYRNEDSVIELRLEDKTISVRIQDGHIITNSDFMELDVSTIYLDNPMILDKERFYDYGINHQKHLRNCLFSTKKRSTLVEEIVTAKKLSRVYDMISTVCSGDFIKKDGEFGYREKASGKILNINNLSAGLKTFVILKTLLLKGFIESGTVLLLDEPEIHLHPEWQLLLAEIIVLLHKEFDLYVLLNTHSHYFLDAIEVYSQKHGVSDACQYYLSSMDGEFAVMENVTGNTEKIYQKLARPLQRLENERYHNED
ncbi:MAG: AAA family ATPase [Oscillibacter sp.]|nr:AAA family ATPase [Oscillibacter sp.]